MSSYVDELKVHFDQSSLSTVERSTCLVRVQQMIVKAQFDQSRTASVSSDTHVYMYIYYDYVYMLVCVRACVCVCVCVGRGGYGCYLRLPCLLICESHEQCTVVSPGAQRLSLFNKLLSDSSS